jgi:hypothetical protein
VIFCIISRIIWDYTARWDLSVKSFTGEDRQYWEALPARLRSAKDSPKMMEEIIKELEALASGDKKREEKRQRLIKTNGFQKKEVVINEQLLAILAALPQEALSGVFRQLTTKSALPAKAKLVDVKLGTGEQLVEPDFLILGGNRLIMGEMKVNTRQGNGATKYDAKKLLNYLSLATKCLSSQNKTLPKDFAHLIILPESELEWFVQGSKWIKNLQTGPDRHMEFNIEAAYSLAEKKRKQKYITDKNGLRQCLADIPVYCRTYRDISRSFEEVISEYPLKEHWQRIALEFRKLYIIATIGLWQWRTGKVSTSGEHFELRYGDPDKSRWDEFIPIARLSAPSEQTFTVEFVIPSQTKHKAEMIEAVKKELDFYLIEKKEKDPWAYAMYHCGTQANLRSRVHWVHCPKC